MRFKIFIVAVLLTQMFAATAHSDRRKFVWSYQPLLQLPDASELEFYQTTTLDVLDRWEYRIEIEHGLASNWDMSIYQIFSQNEGEPFVWDAFQVRTRFRLSSPGAGGLPPVLYLEYRRKLDLKAQNKLEAKVLLGKNFEHFSMALNPVYEFFWAPGDPVHELGLDIGLAYDFSYKLSVGVESTTRHEFIEGRDDETTSYLGPVASVASGPIWYSLGFVFGLNGDSDDARVRFLMGIDL